MTNIKVKNAKLTIDDKEVTTAELSQELLDNIVYESLQGNVEYEIEGDHPLAKFFQTLQDGTKKGSALRQKMDEMKTACGAIAEEGSEKLEENDDKTQECDSEAVDSLSQQ